MNPVEFKRGEIKPVECYKEAWELIRNQYWLLLGVIFVGGIVGGGVPPVISEYLLDRYGSWSIAAMLAGLAMVSLMSVRLLKETAQPRYSRSGQ